MGNPIRAAGRRVLQALGLWPLYVVRTRGPLHDDGWFRSFTAGESVDAEGRPLPWLCYPVIEFLSGRLRADMSVFEYGCGNSTLWWAARVREVISCEHDPAWYERMRPRIPPNVTLRQVDLDGGAYARTVSEYPGRFDIVMLDGRDRVNCAIHAVGALKPGGVILWDNSDRAEYQVGYDHLARLGFRKLPFIGLTTVHCHKNEAGIFYQNDNVLSI